MKKNTDLFETVPVPKAVATMAVPTILSMLVTMLYNMADTFFVGQTNNAMMVSAVSLTAPAFSVFTAFSSLFGVGGSSAISRSMGNKCPEKAKEICSFCIWCTFLTGILAAVILLFGKEQILPALGASDNTYAYAEGYLCFIALGSPFIMLSSVLGSIVRSEGSASRAMIGNIIGTIVNIILDPLMILTADMGVEGAAIATVIGNISACIYYLSCFRKSESTLSVSPGLALRIGPEHILDVISVGFPSMLGTLLTGFVNLLLNRILVSYGDIPVASVGVAVKINTLSIFLLMGLGAGAQPLLGYNFGAGNAARFRKIFRFTAFVSFLTGSFMTIIMILFRRSLMYAFINDPDVVEYGIHMITIFQLSCPVIGLYFLGTNTIQACGKALPGLVLTICRQIIIYLPLLYLLHRIFGLYGAIYAQPVTDFVSVLIAMVLCLRLIKKMPQNT